MQEVKSASNQYKGTLGGVWQDYFALVYLSKEFQRPMDEIVNQVSFGPYDYGIDAFHFDENRRTLYLFQFKWSSNAQLFETSFHRLLSAGMEMIFGTLTPDPDAADVIAELKECIHENEHAIDQVLIQFVFNGEPASAESNAVLDDLREKLEGKKHLIDERFEDRPITLSFRYIKNPEPGEKRKIGGVIHTKKTHQYKITFEQAISTETAKGTKLSVGFIGLIDLVDIYGEMEQRLFDQNIRSGLSPEKSPNRAIRRTLARIADGRDPADEFVFNHNGVTIYAQKLVIQDGEGTALIVEPRILNGAQTVTSVAEFMEAARKKKSFENAREALQSIRVLAKVICNATDDFVINTTICNNRQNQVEPWHLHANDLIQLQFQNVFAQATPNLIYERQEGSFEHMSEDYLEELGIDTDNYRAVAKPIEIKRLAQTFLAVQGNIDKISRPAEVFDTQHIYDSVFRPAYLESDIRQIVMTYKMQFPLTRIIADFVEKYPNAYWFMPRARNLVWALLIQGLLNHEAVISLEQCCEDYGHFLQGQAPFTDILRDLLTKRIRPILARAVADTRISEELQQGNFRSFSQKAMFDRCMIIAAQEYKWEKKSFDRAKAEQP